MRNTKYFSSKAVRFAAAKIAVAEKLPEYLPENEILAHVEKIASLIKSAPAGMLVTFKEEIISLITSIRADLALPLMAAIEEKEPGALVTIFDNATIRSRVSHIDKVAGLALIFNPAKLAKMAETAELLRSRP